MRQRLTERLEIRLEPWAMRLLRAEAQRQHVSVAQLVRQAIAQLLEQDRQARAQAAEALFRLQAPVADWETMKREIEEARAQGLEQPA